MLLGSWLAGADDGAKVPDIIGLPDGAGTAETEAVAASASTAGGTMGSQDSLLGPGTQAEAGTGALTARAVRVPPSMGVDGAELGSAVNGVLLPNKKPPYRKGERKGVALGSPSDLPAGMEVIPSAPLAEIIGAEFLGSELAIAADIVPKRGPF